LDPNIEKQLKSMNRKKKIDTFLKLMLGIRKNILIYVICHVKLDIFFPPRYYHGMLDIF